MNKQPKENETKIYGKTLYENSFVLFATNRPSRCSHGYLFATLEITLLLERLLHDEWFTCKWLNGNPRQHRILIKLYTLPYYAFALCIACNKVHRGLTRVHERARARALSVIVDFMREPRDGVVKEAKLSFT